MTARYSKEQVVKSVLEELHNRGLEEQYSGTVDTYMGLWWLTKRSPSGFQLSGPGKMAFTQAEIEYEDRILDASKKAIFAIERELNKKIKCPFYVEHNTQDKIKHRHAVVRLYDGRIANWIDLHGGISDYLRSIDGYLPN
jgi:hypothetical protein